MKSYLPVYNFEKGLQTRKGEDFTEPDEFREFQNARWDCSRRPGQDRISVLANLDSSAFDFDGSSFSVSAPRLDAVWTLPLQFSLRVVFKQDDASGSDEFLIGWEAGTNPFSLKLNGSRNVVFTFTDSASNTTTMTGSSVLATGTAYSVLITRNKSELKMWVNNTVDATATVSATLLGKAPTTKWIIFGGNGFGAIGQVVNFFDGTIDHVLLMSVALADNTEGFMRIPDPLAEEVMAYYPMEYAQYSNQVFDQSRFENTGAASASGATVTSLCVPELPVRGMVQLDNVTNTKLVIVAGRQFFNAGI